MMRYALTLIFLSSVLGNNVFGQKLTGHVYVLTESFSQNGCNPLIECDCCSSDIVFMTDKNFVMIQRCLYNDAFYKGTYAINKEHLIFTFSQVVINEIFNEETNETKTEKKNVKIAPLKFYITSCEADKLILQQLGIKVLTKAFKETTDKEVDIIKKLKESKAWEILEQPTTPKR